jgi:serine/threonine protein kinase
MKDNQVSHYLLLDKLGEGGMGVVYRAKDTKLGRTVAIKFLPPELTRSEKAKQRFIHEAQAASMIDHQNICTIHEIDETEDGRMFLCMAHYQGRSLKDRIENEGKIDEPEAVNIAMQVAEGLRKAHAHGIVHRDIKPANIFLTDEGEVKILDFGLAKLAGQIKLTTVGKAMGTVSYMSPEQGRGEEVGKETDIWALGVVLYEMVTGELPFKGEYDVAVMYSILNEEPETVTSVRPGISAELGQIVHKAITKDREHRYADITEMMDDLKTLQKQMDPGEPASEYSWIRSRGGLRYAIPAAAIAILAVSAMIVQNLRRGEGDQQIRFAKLPGKPLQITTGDFWDSEPALSPDGGRIAYTSDSQGNKDIFVVDVEGGNKLQLTDDPAADYYPAWFPDGNSIAFVSNRGGSASIWKTSQLGGGATLIRRDAFDPSISPDGTKIAFSMTGEDDDFRIAVAPLSDPGDAVVLTGADDGIWSHRYPVWSPDGEAICYSARHDLWMVPSSGGEAARLTKDGQSDFYPAWSSNGEFIFFTSFRGGTLALWRIDPRGGGPERLTMGTGFEQNPSVCRSGACLAYSTQIAQNAKFIRNNTTGEEHRLEGTRYDFMTDVAPEGDRIV